MREVPLLESKILPSLRPSGSSASNNPNTQFARGDKHSKEAVLAKVIHVPEVLIFHLPPLSESPAIVLLVLIPIAKRESIRIFQLDRKP